MTRSYNSTISRRTSTTAKVSLVARRFVYLERETTTGPDFLIAHDFVTRASSAMEVQWKLRFPANFTIDGTETANAPARKFNPTGIQSWLYENATTIHGLTGSSADGTAGVNAESYTTILQPTSATVMKNARLAQVTPNPYLVATPSGGYGWQDPWGAPMPLSGVSYLNTVSHWPYLSFGHAEIRPTGALNHRFFVVMEICAGGATQTPVTSLTNWEASGGEVTGPFAGQPTTATDACRIGTRAIVIASQNAWTAQAAPLDPVYASAVNQAVVVDATAIYQLIAIDCTPSRTYTVAVYYPDTDTTNTLTTAAADDQGVLVVNSLSLSADAVLVLK
jgi:hypothetical protein